LFADLCRSHLFNVLLKQSHSSGVFRNFLKPRRTIRESALLLK
jgi:hypothetical protein